MRDGSQGRSATFSSTILLPTNSSTHFPSSQPSPSSFHSRTTLMRWSGSRSRWRRFSTTTKEHKRNLQRQNSFRSSKEWKSKQVVEAFSSIIPLANDADAVEWISHALLGIINNDEETQQKFATPEFLKIFQGMEKHATTNESRTAVRSVVEFIDPNKRS
jgi:hypothetical protein